MKDNEALGWTEICVQGGLYHPSVDLLKLQNNANYNNYLISLAAREITTWRKLYSNKLNSNTGNCPEYSDWSCNVRESVGVGEVREVNCVSACV